VASLMSSPPREATTGHNDGLASDYRLSPQTGDQHHQQPRYMPPPPNEFQTGGPSQYLLSNPGLGAPAFVYPSSLNPGDHPSYHPAGGLSLGYDYQFTLDGTSAIASQPPAGWHPVAAEVPPYPPPPQSHRSQRPGFSRTHTEPARIDVLDYAPVPPPQQQHLSAAESAQQAYQQFVNYLTRLDLATAEGHLAPRQPISRDQLRAAFDAFCTTYFSYLEVAERQFQSDKKVISHLFALGSQSVR
jgi:hypothetical protein